MTFLHQKRHRRRQQQRQQRGPYVTKACTIANKTIQNVLEKHPANVVHDLILCVLLMIRNDFDRTPMLFSVISNDVQGCTSTLSSPSGYSQQSYDIDGFTLYSDSYEEQKVLAFQEVGPVLYQTRTDTRYVMLNNNLLDNTSANYNVFDDLFFDYYYMLPFYH
ncbi:hypothetical protein C2G38_2208523 [Gigaspora rosea]|uniref:Uncharacterized protein n=1 Tax=Gigaspora rosea TaxID=44941 RepID=A0A397UHJ8_9GLOM|nr:hypothetical protein C2G38_2208523 [Gigaspora rosea]